MPELFIITGSNGAGKSSLGKYYLPPAIQNNYVVFDADKLTSDKKKELWRLGIRSQKELREKADEYVVMLFEALVDDAIKTSDHFVYEGHFAFNETWDTPVRFKNAGYRVTMIFFGLFDVDLSEIRVLDRVSFGGHYVSRLNIENNFYGNLETLNENFELIDHILIFDTSETSHILLIELNNQTIEYSTPIEELPNWFIQYLPRLTLKIVNQ